jgi:hypothetical protein
LNISSSLEERSSIDQIGKASSARLLWLLAGPGVLVMLGENGGTSMVPYAATYGVGFFVPFILFTFPVALERRK